MALYKKLYKIIWKNEQTIRDINTIKVKVKINIQYACYMYNITVNYGLPLLFSTPQLDT